MDKLTIKYNEIASIHRDVFIIRIFLKNSEIVYLSHRNNCIYTIENGLQRYFKSLNILKDDPNVIIKICNPILYNMDVLEKMLSQNS